MTQHSICSGWCPAQLEPQLSPIQLHVDAHSASPLPLTCPGLLGLPWRRRMRRNGEAITGTGNKFLITLRGGTGKAE